MLTRSTAVLSLVVLWSALGAQAATSPTATASPFGGNGHNVTFDGRLFIARTSPGWEATVFKPESVGTLSSGFPDMSAAFSPWTMIQPEVSNENALAICEETPQPSRCDQAGQPNGTGAYDCYNVVIIDSDALAPAPTNVMRARKLRVVVRDPKTTNATVDSFTWTQQTPTPLSTTLRGIEPTVTKDGKLLVWQGVPSNNGDGDTIVYSFNNTPCGLTGWTAPKSITAMSFDALVKTKYKLAERPLKGADGTLFANNQQFFGAYPWIFPDGEALNFTATGMPCRNSTPGSEDPPGCGPRRNALSFIGYLTNWQVAHVDGAVNPSREDNVRLFFSSPGPKTFSQVPKTPGVDVWPFFGSNTQNYSEIIFDDALDGRYAGLWHMNELVTNAGAFDLTRTPDSSGYSNTGRLVGGSALPAVNNGALGKALVVNGSNGRVEALHAASLNPTNAITLEMMINPASSPDCDGTNNYRILMSKGGIGTGSYTIVIEDNRDMQARVRVSSGLQYNIAAGYQAPLNQWTHIAIQYHAATGTMVFLVNGLETNRVTHPPALLAGSQDKLTIGGPNATRATCPVNGDGYFHGLIDEVGISNIWRYGAVPGPVVVDAGTPVVDAGAPVVDAGTPTVDAGQPDAGGGGGGGGGSTGSGGGAGGGGGSTGAGGGGGTSGTGGGDGSGAGGGEGGGVAPGAGGGSADPGSNDNTDAVGGFGCSSGGAPMLALAMIIAARVLLSARRRRQEEVDRASLPWPLSTHSVEPTERRG